MWYSKSILIGREAWEWRREFWLEEKDSWIFNTLVYTNAKRKMARRIIVLYLQLYLRH